MPRKLNSRLTIIFFTIGVLLAYYAGCPARETASPSITPGGEFAQLDIPSDSADHLPVIIPDASANVVADSIAPDTVILEPVLYIPGEDSLMISLYHSEDTTKGTIGSPTLNLFKSMAFPGWGQYCNRRYIKAGVIFAVESYFIYKAIDNGRQASDWRTKWQEAPAALKSLYFSEYTGYRDRRNTFLWYTALTVFLSMFDAYVDAHLRNFPKKASGADRLSIEAVPGEETHLTLRYHF